MAQEYSKPARLRLKLLWTRLLGAIKLVNDLAVYEPAVTTYAEQLHKLKEYLVTVIDNIKDYEEEQLHRIVDEANNIFKNIITRLQEEL